MNENLPIKKKAIPQSKNSKDTIKLECGIRIE